MAQNLKAAMAMEKVYRKLQDNRVAKDAFGYQDKLKRFGFPIRLSMNGQRMNIILRTQIFQLSL